MKNAKRKNLYLKMCLFFIIYIGNICNYIQQFIKQILSQKMSCILNKEQTNTFVLEQKKQPLKGEKHNFKSFEVQEKQCSIQKAFKCWNCEKLKKKLLLLKKTVQDIKKENSSFLQETQLLFANFSYIMELVGDNLASKYQQVSNNLKENQKKMMKHASSANIQAVEVLKKQHSKDIQILKEKVAQLEQQSALLNEKLKLKTQESSQSLYNSSTSENNICDDPQQLVASTRSEGKKIKLLSNEISKKIERNNRLSPQMQSIQHLRKRIKDLKVKLQK